MKILHVQHSLDPRSGGPSESLRELVSHQLALGHQVQVVATDAQSIEPWEERFAYLHRLHEDARFYGVGLYIGKAYGRTRPWSRFSYSPACVAHLREKFRDPQRKPEVVHIHGVFSHLTHAAAAEARKAGIPYIIRPAGSLNEACLDSGRAKFKKLLYRWGGVQADLQGAAFIHATSEREREELRELGIKTRVEIIPHGIRLPDVDCKTAIQAFHTRLPELKGKPFWLYMSRIAPKKRLDLLLGAFAQRRAQGSDWHMVIAGTEDGLQDKVKRIIRQQKLESVVHFAGFLQGPTKQGAIFASEAVALTSTDENFGVIIVEGMAHGKPCLVTPGVDTHRYVKAADAGIVTSLDADVIAHDMARLEQANRKEMGLRAQEYAQQNLSWHSTCQRLSDLYSQISEQSPHERSQQSLEFPAARQRHHSNQERVGQHRQVSGVS
ncbi:MAG: glycosyltransferase [Verrucomicrobiota bacterium JB022]|nr:glycosyltransferase [Verrucomicrobiota bacterium JB022]